MPSVRDIPVHLAQVLGGCPFSRLVREAKGEQPMLGASLCALLFGDPNSNVFFSLGCYRLFFKSTKKGHLKKATPPLIASGLLP